MTTTRRLGVKLNCRLLTVIYRLRAGRTSPVAVPA
jgi:hypothetical protein